MLSTLLRGKENRSSCSFTYQLFYWTSKLYSPFRWIQRKQYFQLQFCKFLYQVRHTLFIYSVYPSNEEQTSTAFLFGAITFACPVCRGNVSYTVTSDNQVSPLCHDTNIYSVSVIVVQCNVLLGRYRELIARALVPT